MKAFKLYITTHIHVPLCCFRQGTNYHTLDNTFSVVEFNVVNYNCACPMRKEYIQRYCFHDILAYVSVFNLL